MALNQRYPTRQLSQGETEGLSPKRKWSRAWEVSHGRANHPVLYFAVDRDFPATMPGLLVPNGERLHLVVPHVNSDGSLCVASPLTTFDQFNCGGVAIELIERGIEILEGNGEADRDFAEEVQTYWSGAAIAPTVTLINALAPTSGWLHGLHIGNRVYVGSVEVGLRRWVGNLTAKTSTPLIKVAHIHLEKPPVPVRYPQQAGDLLQLGVQHGLGKPEELAALSRRQDGQLYFVISFEAEDQIEAVSASIQDAHRISFKGWRKGSVTAAAVLQRVIELPCKRHATRRADPDWLVWRGGTSAPHRNIKEASVMVIGCGSVGSDIVMLLAKTGVRRFVLVDDDILSFDNIGRHLLGASAVGGYKTQMLKARLLLHFPHLQIECREKTAQKMCGDEDEQLMQKQHVIVCATGDWMAESAINFWQRKMSVLTVPVVYAWLEPHGMAGHALLSRKGGGCLACGRDETGVVRNRVIDWKNGQLKKTPACGGWFTPYGALESNAIKELATRQVVLALTDGQENSLLQTYIGDASEIGRLNGSIRDEWQPWMTNEGALISRTIKREWLCNQKCPVCLE